MMFIKYEKILYYIFITYKLFKTSQRHQLELMQRQALCPHLELFGVSAITKRRMNNEDRVEYYLINVNLILTQQKHRNN